MLRIGKLTDYAMSILATMAKDPTVVKSAATLAEQLVLPATTVSKILKILSEANLVSSLRGAEGGYKLNQPASSLSVAKIIAVMEGDITMTECCESSALCALQTQCSMKENWLKINKTIAGLLSRISLTEMMAPLNLQDISHE